MSHIVERAATGRARCRVCGGAVAKDSWRIGEAVPNLFADGEGALARHWYHPRCAALRRPEAFLAAIEGAPARIDDHDELVAIAARGVAHPRLARLDRAERSSSGRAACRACRTPIAKDSWRLALLFWQDGRFAPAGFLHPGCAAGYLGTADVIDRVRHFTPGLGDAEAAAVAAALLAPPPAPLAATPE